MIERLAGGGRNVLGVRVSGKLHDADYKEFVPQVDRLITEYGSVRVLMLFEGFEGWDLHAAWDDAEFEVKHRRDIVKLAVVGEPRGQQWLSGIARLMVGEVRHFEPGELAEAWVWVSEG